MLAWAMRSGFPNRGTRTMAVRMAHCAAMEIISARRRMRRSHFCCPGLPSTKQPSRDANSFCGMEMGPGSLDITHLHRKVLRGRTEIYATPAPCGLLNDRRRPAPRSQGCEVRASSVKLDTGEFDKFPDAAGACTAPPEERQQAADKVDDPHGNQAEAVPLGPENRGAVT
jgi:hypothetical protein